MSSLHQKISEIIQKRQGHSRWQSRVTNFFPFTIGQGNVIKGWDQGLKNMKEGGIRKLIVPPELAYGSQNKGEKIPPNSTLIFLVHLLKVN